MSDVTTDEAGERCARQAGFSGIEELPIEGFASFRFTRLLR